MKYDDLSLRHLRIVEAIHRTKSVSKAAEELELAQPVVSVGLAKLRSYFNDSLFIRTRVGMIPTPAADGLLDAAKKALAAMDAAVSSTSHFDPRTTARHFRIEMNQIPLMLVFPRIVLDLRRHSPNTRLDARTISGDTLLDLETGSLDLAIGNIAHVGAGYLQRTLIESDFICIASQKHPRISQKLTLERFLAERHVVASSMGSVTNVAESWMRKKRIARDVAVQVPDLLGLDHIVAGSELIATVPRTAVLFYASVNRRLRVFEHPLSLPKWSTKMYWHERQQRDPAHRWLRELVAQKMMKYAQ